MPTFSDIPEDHPYYDAIEWAAANGITIGYPDGTYQSDRAVSRGEMAVFLQRYDGAVPLPPDPPGPQPPMIPPGTEVNAEDLDVALAGGAEGEVFRVRPGNIPVAARNKAKNGQQIWGLGGFDPQPGVMPKLDGGGIASPGLEGTSESNPTFDVVWAYVELTGFDPADPSWVELSGNQGDKRRQPTIRGKTFRDSQFVGLWVHDTGRGIDGGASNLFGGLYEYCHHMYLHASSPNGGGFTVRNMEARYTNVRRSDGKAYFVGGWERGVKVVNWPGVVVEDLYSHDNMGPGWWADGNGNRDHVYRRIRAEDNDDQGIHYEIAYRAKIHDCITARNGGAGDLYLSNVRGDSVSAPMLVKGGRFGPHLDRGVKAAIAVKNNGNRTPLTDFVRIEDAVCEVASGGKAIVYFGGGPTPTSIVAVNCVDQDANPVTIDGL